MPCKTDLRATMNAGSRSPSVLNSAWIFRPLTFSPALSPSRLTVWRSGGLATTADEVGQVWNGVAPR